jgi:hypothetical protein
LEIRVRGTPHQYQWAADRSAADLHWAVEDIRIIPDGDTGTIRLVIEADRAGWFWVWGHTDAGLVEEVMEAQFEGKPSNLLEEVRAAFARYMPDRE